MISFLKTIVLLTVLGMSGTLRAQAPQKVHGADTRFKADILVVVAHPDDEAFFTPYLARAMDDMHKHVAVIFSTRGGSGGNRTCGSAARRWRMSGKSKRGRRAPS